MKDFDIEKLKRENVFKMPDGFFEDMQDKVLQETVPVTRGKIIKLNWTYGAAAAIALLVGVTAFVNSDSTAETQLFGQTASSTNKAATYTLSNDKPENEATVALQTLEKDLTSVEQTHQKVSIESVAVQTKGNASFADQKKQKVAPNPEVQVDQILASFTSAELADVGRNTEQDIYLDLYN